MKIVVYTDGASANRHDAELRSHKNHLQVIGADVKIVIDLESCAVQPGIIKPCTVL
jgi:hypothetical protein